MTILESTLLAYGRKTVFDNVGTKTDAELLQALTDASDMLAEEHRWPHLLRRSSISTQAPYSTGTITLTSGATTCAGSGTTFPASWAATGRILLTTGQILEISAYNSATSLTLASAYGGDTAAGLSYTLFKNEYALPDDLFEFKQILPGSRWPSDIVPVPIEDLWATENLADVNMAFPTIFAVANGELSFFPYGTDNISFAYSYYARPTPTTGAGGSATVDWPAALRQMFNRAYDYQLALRFGKTVMGTPEDCWKNYQRALPGAKVRGDSAPKSLPNLQDAWGGMNDSNARAWHQR